MPTFPTLAKNPDAEKYIESHAIDPTIRSEMENGKIITRKRFTTVPRTWAIAYRFLSNANKNTLATFERDTANFGVTAFDWANPMDSTTYSVRFADNIRYKIEVAESSQWRVDIILVEAL